MTEANLHDEAGVEAPVVARMKADVSPPASSPQPPESEAPEVVYPSGRPKRTCRSRSAVDAAGAEFDDELASASRPVEAPCAPVDRPRRNPRRARARPHVAEEEEPSDDFVLPENLLDAALAPMRPDELEAWQGWIELESEPAFFNVILRDLGVEDVRVQELFSVDDDSLAALPKPVHGLIFLHQYVGADVVTDDNPPPIWFANQTTNNACATFALLNIIMNAAEVKLGDKLRAFKAETQHLAPPLRGWLVSNNKWIRKIHNSFARRLDLLCADLALKNEESEPRPKRSRKNNTRRKRTPSKDAAYHFTAYVPVGNKVYQLDGLESAPNLIGEYAGSGDWTAVARPLIESRMLQHHSEEMSFNLLAVCQAPLAILRRRLAANLRALVRLEDRMARVPGWGAVPSAGEELLDPSNDAQLAEYGLSRSAIMVQEGSGKEPEWPSTETDRKAELSDATGIYHGRYGLDGSHKSRAETQGENRNPAPLTIEEASSLRHGLEDEQTRLRAQYVAEMTAAQEDARRVAARRRDYTQFIHAWVKELAERNVLKQLHDETIPDESA
ncbi:hypothetical protein VTK73DRAFT_9182 [Phialemonium thermophilum]|uniref:Ubiquitin carboxyl-terminal hydrolase n=1 Tax=Phialemonium thermophilum TaxID=223376 RepID=A0ABR3W451_9PEZI